MPKKDYSEDLLIQAPTAELLEKELGWVSVFAHDDEAFGPGSLLARNSDRDVVLTIEVEAALRRLNPGLPTEAYEEALAQVLLEDVTKTLVQMNEEKYKFLRDGIPVKYRDATGKLVDRRLKLIDFDDATKNRYHAVRELWVRGRLWLRRPDVICFVNGLPLVFIELKRFELHIDSAYKKNFSDYLDTIPHLFHWNALIVISNGHDAQYGSVTSSMEHFYRWKRLDEDDPEPKPEQPLLPILLAGMLDRTRLLDIVENFVLFDATEGSTQKIVARNHQFLGVNRVVDRLMSKDPKIQAEVTAGQLGVFWHTQGSGKSYSMVFLTEKIHRKLSASYSFVVITDRSELDDQIASTYTNTGRANSKTDQAKNSDQLRRMLRDQNRRYIFALVQKYREKVIEPYSERGDIIIISDEAHRTQYGRLALNMRKALPRAKFIGFTGTPLIEAAEKQLTREVFGGYDFQRAVADKATLPLFYENRGEKLKIIDPTVNKRIEKRIDAARQTATMEDPWTEEREEKLYRELARDYPILTSPTRLNKVSQDFVDHYHQRWRVVENGGGKAMMVCLDKITCVKIHDLIVFKWREKIEQLEMDIAAEEALFAAKGKSPDKLLKLRREHVEWMKATETCVVVSQEQGEVADFKKWTNFKDEPLDIVPHREKMVKRDLEKEFKKVDHPFRIAIVCAMWLTGFDVKCLATLYLDKPMKGHTLMQAIARVNRVGGGKKHGLIIDYNGMLKSLRRALATFAQGDRSGTGKGEGEQDTVRDDSEALAEYADSLKQAQDFLGGLGFDLNKLISANGFTKQSLILTAVNRLCETDERRKTYEVIVEDVHSRHRALFPHPGLFTHDAEESAVSAIYNKLQDSRESPDVSSLLQSLYEVVDTALTTDRSAIRAVGNQPTKQYDLSNIDFARLRAEFQRTPFKSIVTLNLKEKIEERLAMMVARNPTRVDLYERYQEIVREYNKDKDEAEIQKVFDQLNAFNSSLNEEEKRYLREGLDNEDQLAVFDLLQKESLTKGDRDSIKKVAKELLDKLTSGKLQIDHWREKATAQAQVKAEIIKHLFANMPPGAYDDEEINLKASAVFAHIYTAGSGDGERVYH